MTRADVIRMAQEAEMLIVPSLSELERFASLVAASEREACARIVESVNSYDNPMTAGDCSDAIRKKGQS